MYTLSPSTSLAVGCALKWPLLTPLAAIGLTAYTLCGPAPEAKPVPTQVTVPAPAPVPVTPPRIALPPPAPVVPPALPASPKKIGG